MTCVEKLGAGGFSDVYLYEQQHPRLKVAVKLLKTDVLDDAQRRQFAAEADVMAELAEHPFIVPVLSTGTAPDGRPYLAMRYFPPPDLGARVAKAQMSVADALRTGIQLASAVETAHRSGIIHRDIKPANVLVSSYGVPALSDFGIAGRGDRTEDDENLGVSMPWSPPEVLAGRSNGSATSDVYSLAATIWHLLVGRSPFAVPGDNSERALFGRILHGKPPTVGRADTPTSLDRLLQQAMAKDPAHRPRTALEFARHLQRVEQELRLARTEIVVLETEEPPPDLELTRPPAGPSPAPTTATGAVTTDDDGLTLLKRPVTVRPSTPVPPPVPRRPQASTEELTERRPRLASTATPAPASDEATEMRPFVVGPSSRTDEADSTNQSDSNQPRRHLAAVLVALVGIAAVATAILLSRTGDGEPEAPTPSAAGPSAGSEIIGDLPVDVELRPADVALEVSQTAMGLVFTASGTDGAQGLQWSAKVGAGNYAHVPGSTAQVTVALDGADTACVQLRQVYDGQLVELAEKCGRG